MQFTNHDQLMQKMTNSMKSLMDEYNLEEIGVYEEEGKEDLFYMGYTVRKNEHVYMVSQPYVKNEQGQLALKDNRWTIQSEHGETKGYQSLGAVFHELEK